MLCVQSPYPRYMGGRNLHVCRIPEEKSNKVCVFPPSFLPKLDQDRKYFVTRVGCYAAHSLRQDYIFGISGMQER